ncbi:pyridoxal phosphate-dependent class II aminotransferase [Bacillaceae bacterium]
MGWIEKYGHGGDRLTAAAAFGVEPESLLDFSANINPLGPPQGVLERLREAWSALTDYPDPAHRVFRRGLAEKLGVAPEAIVVGNGAAECMALAILALAPKRVGLVYPCFSEYGELARRFGASVNGIFGREERDFKPERSALYRLFAENDLVFLGHPNNPTGITYDRDELEEMASWTKRTGAYLVIDEAFLDFLPEAKQATLLHALDAYPRVILIRSLTKFYAIPGLRLGFAVARPSLASRLKEKQVTWSVNQFALLAGEACLKETAYAQRTRELIARERAYLIRAIRERFRWKVWPGEANFLLIRLPPPLKADDLQWALGRLGIMIRSCATYPGLTAHDFRIAVRTREENDRLLAALAQAAGQTGTGGEERA